MSRGTHLALIGMSNVGKSHWSQKLSERIGFWRICCDDDIGRLLMPELTSAGFTGKIEEVAEWMGLPHEARSPERQLTYLSLEERVLSAALEQMPTNKAANAAIETASAVIDTTGSVIYLPDEQLGLLRNSTTIIYLEASAAVQEEMLRRYVEHPKPVIWGDRYRPLDGEDPMQALARCYPDLLAWRSERYAALAHVTIPYEVHRAPDFSIDQLLSYLPV